MICCSDKGAEHDTCCANVTDPEAAAKDKQNMGRSTLCISYEYLNPGAERYLDAAVLPSDTFDEKVVKVKADVAAILK